MTTTTTWLGIPVPEATDAPNGPAQMLAIAERLELVVPAPAAGAGSLTTSSSSLVDISGASCTVTTTVGSWVHIAAFAQISPSGAGDAKVNLSIDGVDFGQIMQVNAGGAALTNRWMLPGSTTGNAMAGGRLFTALGSGSKVVKLRALSTSGSAFFSATLYVWRYAE